MPIKTLQEMRILVVDDDAFILKTLTRILQKAGVTKLICSDVATEALKHLSSRLKPVDVLISDLNMPELDGIELIRYIGELPNKISLILISGEDKRILETAESIAKERQIDVLGSLQKPILAPELLEMLQSRSHPTPSEQARSKRHQAQHRLAQGRQPKAEPTLHLSDLRFLVFDEADVLFDDEFGPVLLPVLRLAMGSTGLARATTSSPSPLVL